MSGEQSTQASAGQRRTEYTGQIAQGQAHQSIGDSYFNGPVAQENARQNWVHNYNYTAPYQKPQSPLFSGILSQRKRNKELLEAAQNGYTHRVQILLRSGADVDYKAGNGSTALHCAAEKGYCDIAKMLLEAGSVVNARNKFRLTPLHYAAYQGQESVVRLLLTTQGIKKNAEGSKGQTPLRLAAKRGHPLVVRALLEHGCWDYFAFRYAVQKELSEIANMLLDAGIAPSADSETDWTPLHYAAQQGEVELVSLLLSAQGIEKDARDSSSRTPLHYTVLYGYISFVKVLIEHGCQVGIEDEDGWPPLHYAISTNNVPAAKMLVEAGASLSVKAKSGETPLDTARRFRGQAMIEYLEGAEASQQQPRGGSG